MARRNVTTDDATDEVKTLLASNDVLVPLGLKTRTLGNRILILLDSRSDWIMMTPKLARQLAAELYLHANKLDGKNAQ